MTSVVIDGQNNAGATTTINRKTTAATYGRPRTTCSTTAATAAGTTNTAEVGSCHRLHTTMPP